MLLHNPSPPAGEGGARALSEAKGVGGRGGASRQATQKNLCEALARKALLLKRARFMRAHPTDAERRLWKILRAKRFSELKWKRQQIIDDRYIVDFICFEHRLIIEADGSQHDDSRNDTLRDGYLKAQSFHILRFWNSDVLARTNDVGETIFAAIESLTAQMRGAPSPSHACGAGPFLPRQGGGKLESTANV